MVCGESRQNEEVSMRETALRGLLGINGQNEEDDARVVRVSEE